ncbi:MAG TPA: polyphosphate polymerase domain-containing protein [Oscillatoriaceae cyanobacterium]
MATFDELLADATSAAQLYAFREERKYLVPVATAQALRQALAERLDLEQFVPGRPRSRVHSIYFDSPDLALYRESLGEENSLKLRLRAYASLHDEGEPTVFLECKLGVREAARRKKRKLRWALPPAMLATLVEKRYEALEPDTQPKFWRKALGLLAERELVPRLSICYEREAYVSPDGRLRVTLDEGYRASRIEAERHSPLDAAQGDLPGLAILEVKLLGEFPEWLGELLLAWGIPSEGQSFSKYKTAVPVLFPDHPRVGATNEAS